MGRAHPSLAAVIALVATPAAAQQAPPTPEAEAAQLVALRQDLVAARQEIVRLRAEVAGQRDQAAALAQCRERNNRLVAIGDELIAAYQKRYARGRFLPFESGRRKFEADMQEIGGRVYDNRFDAGPRRAEPRAKDAPAPPAPEKHDDR